MDRSDWTLLAIAAGERPLSPVQLQKSLFLVEENMGDEVEGEFYEFEPYDYGPFCQTIYEDAESLAAMGLVQSSPASAGNWSEFSPTQAGLERAEAVLEEAPGEVVAYLEEAVEWTQSLSFNALVRAIYSHFPEYKKNSVFED